MPAGLPDDALVVRGGSCTAERFQSGSGVSVDENGRLNGVSVNAGARDLEALCRTIPNRHVGVTSVGAVRRAGGEVAAAPSSRNPDHCVMSGLTAEQAQLLFQPVRTNPSLDH